MPEMITLMSVCDCTGVNFSQCRFGAPTRKDTTFTYTQGFSAILGPLHDMSCDHAPHEHEQPAGGDVDEDGNWISSEHAAFPPALNYFIAQAMMSVALQHGPVDDTKVPAGTIRKVEPPSPAKGLPAVPIAPPY